MKTKHLLIVGACFVTAINFTSCKKEDASEPAATEVATTTDLAAKSAISDEIGEDNNNVFMEASAGAGLTGNRPVAGERPLTPNILGATISVTPGGFPKTITLDFGTGVTGPHGITRSGRIFIVLSDSARKFNSTAVMTFDNYYVNKFKVEGTHTWKNTTQDANKSWEHRVENGKITDSLGNYWLHSGIRNVVQTGGSSTPFNLSDDEFTITGNHTITNPAGRTRTVTVIFPLIKANSCPNISRGTVKIEGPRHSALIDYGNGTCDKDATISIDGGTAIAFRLH